MTAKLKSSITLVCYALLFGCGSSTAAIDCSEYEAERIARIDQSNQRIFVTAGADDIEDTSKVRKLLQDLGAYVGACQEDWTADWSVSVFSENKMVGYKDEPELREYVMDRSWEKAYLAEFSADTGVLTRYPAIPDKRDEVGIELDE